MPMYSMQDEAVLTIESYTQDIDTLSLYAEMCVSLQVASTMYTNLNLYSGRPRESVEYGSFCFIW